MSLNVSSVVSSLRGSAGPCRATAGNQRAARATEEAAGPTGETPGCHWGTAQRDPSEEGWRGGFQSCGSVGSLYSFFFFLYILCLYLLKSSLPRWCKNMGKANVCMYSGVQKFEPTSENVFILHSCLILYNNFQYKFMYWNVESVKHFIWIYLVWYGFSVIWYAPFWL